MHRIEKNILHHAKQRKQIRKLKSKIMNEYILIEFPESQKYMGFKWFNKESHLCIDISSAYFIPKNRIDN